MRLRCELTPRGFVFAVDTDRPCRFSVRYIVHMTGGHWTAGHFHGQAVSGYSRHECDSPLPVLSVGVEDVTIDDADVLPTPSRPSVADESRADPPSILRRASPDLPVFSVVLPVHDGAGSIDRCIRSVLEQSYPRFELIVVDDGSMDSTLRDVARHFDADPPVRVISSAQPHGIAHSLNQGLHQCRGEWIVPLGVEYRLHPFALATLARAAEHDPDAGGMFGSTHLCAGDTPLEVRPGRDVCGFVDCLEHGRVQAPVAYRVRLLRRLGGWKTDDGAGGGAYQEQLTAARVAETAPLRFVGEALAFAPAEASVLSRFRGVSAAALKTSIVEWEAARRGLSVRSEWAADDVLRVRLSPRQRRPLRHCWSVVIAASWGGALLRNALQSWLESENGASATELIVVDDSMSQDLRATVPSDIGDRVCWLAMAGHTGAAAARNAGARASTSEFLYFSDADRIVQPDTLITHEAAHAAGGGDALVVGSAYGRHVAALSSAVPPDRRRRLLQVARETTMFDRLAGALAFGYVVEPSGATGIWSRMTELSFADASSLAWAEYDVRNGRSGDEGVGRWLRVDAGALSMSRRSWQRLGGFDEQLFPIEHWGLGIRAVECGFRIVPEPAAEPVQQLHPAEIRRSARDAHERFRRTYARHIAALSALPPTMRPPGAESILTGVRTTTPSRAEAVGCDAPGFCLTFDDGPHAVNTPAILDRLDELGWPATFFVLGCRANESRDLVKRMAASRHVLAVHAWDHRHPCEVPTAEMDAGVRRTAHLLEDLIGERVAFCRPPYGELTPAYAEAARSLHLTPVGWDVSSKDWDQTRPEDVITELAVGGVRANVILFHDGCGDGALLADVLAWLARHADASRARALTLDQLSRHRVLPGLELQHAIATLNDVPREQPSRAI